MVAVARPARRGQRTIACCGDRGRKLIGAAVVSALGSTVGISSANTYWDVNGTAPDSGVVNNATVDWLGGTVASAATWDGTIANSNWNTDPTGGGAGTLNPDVGASDTGVFSAGADAAGKTYFAVVPDNGDVTAGGLAVGSGQGTVIIPGYGNAGAGGRGALGGGGINPSKLEIGSGTFNIDVATGSALHLGFRLALMSPTGSATIAKTGGGLFNNATYTKSDLNPGFFGKWDVQAGTMGIFFGGNTMLGNPASFVADQLKVSNNAVIKTFQQNSSVTINANEGITIGPGGATFFFAGAKELDPGYSYTSLGLINFSSKMTGGSEGAGRVPITIMSNIVSPTLAGAGQGAGCIAAGFADNSTSLFAKWIIKSGEIQPQVAALPGTDLGLGVIPPAPLADAITLDGGNFRPNASITIAANRGITLGAAGGGLNPINAITFTVNPKITGVGQLRAYLQNNANGKIILNGANDYTGGTWVTGVAGTTPIGQLQGSTTSLQGNIQVDGTATLIFDQTTTGSYAGTISSTGKLAKNNSGIVYFMSSNTYSGGTTVNGGVLVANSTASLPGYATAGKVVVNNGGAVAASAGGAGQWLSSDIDTLRTTTTFNAGSSLGISVDTPNTFTYASNITQTIGFVKLGGGELILSGTNTYNGTTSLLGGVLSVSASSNLGDASATNGLSFNGGTLKATGGIASAARNVTVNAGGATFNTGVFAIVVGNVDGTGPMTKNDGGTLLATHLRVGNVTVNDGRIEIGHQFNPDTPAAAAGVSRVGSIAVGATGKLNIQNNKLITSAPVGTANAGLYNGASGLIQSGRGSGSWNGASGITTSEADATGGNFTSIGVATGQQVKGLANPTDTATWAGQTVIGTDTLVMYTYGGDANLDGKINVDDYGRIDFNVNLGTAGWFNGDFNYDGKINVDDYGIIDFNVGIQGAPFFTAGGTGGVSLVPEPTAGVLGCMALIMMPPRRRGRRRHRS